MLVARDRAASPVIGLLAAGVVYLLLFTLLLGARGTGTGESVEFRVLADKSESATSLLLGTTGETSARVSANPHFVVSGQTIGGWVLANGVVREANADGLGRDALRIPVNKDATSVRTPVAAASYEVATTFRGSIALDVAWYADDDATSAIRTDRALAATTAGWDARVSSLSAPPAGATRALVKAASTSGDLLLNATELRLRDLRGWEGNPDGLTRFGLVEEDAKARGFSAPTLPSVLDYGKLAALRAGETSSAANGAPDYADVRTALGIGEGFQFHLRTYPVFRSLADAHFDKDRAIEPAYLGHFETSPASAALDVATVPGPGSPPAWVDFHATVENGGSAAMLYRLTLSLGGGEVVDELLTPLVAAGGSTTVVHRLYGAGAVADWKLESPMHVRLQDAHSNELGERQVAFTAPQDLANAWNVRVQPASAYFVAGGSPPQVFLDHYDGAGDRLRNGVTIDVTIRNVATGEVAWTTQGLSLPKNRETSIVCSAVACSVPGTYRIETARVGGGYAASEIYEVLPEPPEQSSTESVASIAESAALASLLAKFENVVGGSGDKYRDTKKDTDRLIADLPQTSLLVVGSEVRHAALTSASVKYGIRDWVHAGGTLLVFGSASQNVEWLEPLQGSGLDRASGGIGAPDPTHPALHAPESLAYQSYVDWGNAWSLRSGDEYYTHVLVREGQANQGSLDMLAVSKPGAFGLGTVVLTAYTPHDLFPGTSPAEEQETRKLLHNLVAQAYTLLHVDYGPPIPSGSAVGSTTRLALVPHPGIPGAVVEVRVVLYVFRG